MKKNLVLYLLLVFLIVVNAFFLFNYMGKKNDKRPNEPKEPKNFIAKELGFNATQLVQFKETSKGHHENMMRLSDDIKNLKDELFDGLSDVSVNMTAIDSITTLIGEKVKDKELEVFNHFRQVQAICDDKQKKKFKKIIKDALHSGGERGQRPPHRNGPNGHRPPPKRG